MTAAERDDHSALARWAAGCLPAHLRPVVFTDG